jgi:nicotinamidase-related amidase
MPGYPFDPAASALVLIDFQQGVLQRPVGSPVPQAAAEAVERAATVAAAYRTAKLPVILVGVERRGDYIDAPEHGTDLGDQHAPPNGPAPRRLVEGTDDAAFAEVLRRSDSDFVVIKRRVSAFYATQLEMYLKIVDAKTLVFGGVFTDMGVEATVRDAFDRDFEVVVLEDGCWSSSVAGHNHAISHTFPRLGRVRRSEQIIELVQG